MQTLLSIKIQSINQFQKIKESDLFIRKRMLELYLGCQGLVALGPQLEFILKELIRISIKKHQMH